MTDLSTFLLARISEDEAAALEARADFRYSSDDDKQPWIAGEMSGTPVVALSVVRALAECKAKRAVVEMFPTPPEGDGWSHAGWDVLLNLATVYADHPDYRAEWAV